MKVIVILNVHDRTIDWDYLLKDYGFEVVFISGVNEINNELLKDAIGIVGYDPHYFNDEKNIDYLVQQGIKYLVTKSTGYEHLNLVKLKEAGIKSSNIKAYSPSAISELTVGLLINLVRNIPEAFENNNKYKFSVDDLAPEIKHMTIGIIGVGAIGKQTARTLSGFGAKLLGYDKYPDDKMKDIITYTDLDEIKKQADAIVLHVPSLPMFHHFIDKKFIKECSKRPFVINTARGDLINNEDIMEAVENGDIRGYGADVYEFEQNIFFHNLDELHDETLKKMLGMYPRILMTPHIGAKTIAATKAMLKLSLDNMQKFIDNKVCEDEL